MACFLGGAKPPEECGAVMADVQSIESPAIHPEERGMRVSKDEAPSPSRFATAQERLLAVRFIAAPLTLCSA